MAEIVKPGQFPDIPEQDQEKKSSITRRGFLVGAAATAAGAVVAEGKFGAISNIINRLSGNNSSPEDPDQKAVSGFDPEGGSVSLPTNTPEQQVVDPTNTPSPSPTPTEVRPSSTPTEVRPSPTEYDNTATPAEDFEPTPTQPKPPEATATQETEAWDRSIDISVSADPDSAPELAAINLVPNPIYSRVNQYGETIDGHQTLQEFGWRVLAQLDYASQKREGGFDIEEVNNIDYKAFAQNVREQEGYTFQVLGHPTKNPDTGQATDPQTGKEYWKRNHEPQLIDVDPSKGIGFEVVADESILNIESRGNYKGSFILSKGIEGRIVVDEKNKLTLYIIANPNASSNRETNGLFGVKRIGPVNYQFAALGVGEYAKFDAIVKGNDINGISDKDSDATLRDTLLKELDPSTPSDDVQVYDDNGRKRMPLLIAR